MAVKPEWMDFESGGELEVCRDAVKAIIDER